MLLVRENSLKNNLIGLSTGPQNTRVTDDTDLFYWFSKSHYPYSPVVAMNACCVAVPISWVPVQCGQGESWFPCCWGPFCLKALWPLSGHLLQNSSKQLQTLISLVWHTSSRPTLEISMMSAACSTWGSGWEIIKCMNQLSSRWSYPDTARSSMSRKAQLHIWFVALWDSSGGF